MTSRTARKRYRRRESRLKATAGPNIVERWGWGEPTFAIRGDLVLIRQAIRQRWDVPEATRLRLVEAVCHLFDLRRDGPASEALADGLAIQAVRVVVDMEWANMLLERATLAERRALIRGILPGWNAWRQSIAPPAEWPTHVPMPIQDAPS